LLPLKLVGQPFYSLICKFVLTPEQRLKHVNAPVQLGAHRFQMLYLCLLDLGLGLGLFDLVFQARRLLIMSPFSLCTAATRRPGRKF
jgi:hypothetical protein